jgi:hypothetical protein
VADEYDVDASTLVDSFRKDNHKELVQRAQQNDYLQDYIGRRISEPPFPKPPSEKARISGIEPQSPPAAEYTPEHTEPRRGKALFPNKRQSHMRKSYQRFEAVPAQDELSTQRRRRSKRNG